MPLERMTVNSFCCEMHPANTLGLGEWVRVKIEVEFNSQPFAGAF